jgi:hypothetical protein
LRQRIQQDEAAGILNEFSVEGGASIDSVVKPGPGGLGDVVQIVKTKAKREPKPRWLKVRSLGDNTVRPPKNTIHASFHSLFPSCFILFYFRFFIAGTAATRRELRSPQVHSSPPETCNGLRGGEAP